MSSTKPTPPRADAAPSRSLGIVVVLVVAVAAIFLITRAPVDHRGQLEETVASAEPLESAATPPPPPPRCSRTSRDEFRVGKNSVPERQPAPDEGDPTEEDEDLAAAFGAEVSRAATTQAGFAVGVRLDTGSGAEAGIVTVDGSGKNGRLIELGRSRGDFDAPLVTPLGDDVLVSFLEPNASGGTLKVGTLRGAAAPKWSVELDLSRDESLAFDVASGPRAVVVAWDDVTKDGKLARVVWSSLDPRAEHIARKPAAASSKAVDAETPRIVPRPGGFWLAYIARKTVALPKKDDDEALDRSPKGDRYAAEKIDPSWLELLPLDEAGAPIGVARAVTDKNGHALSFDLATTASGEALLAWRDDDTPSGSHGGRVSLMAIPLSGGERTQVLVESDVGSGSPTLLPGWVAIPNASGLAMLAPLAADGSLGGELRLEPAIGAGEPLHAHDATLLVATSVGTAIDLVAVECRP
ncbi:MAG: hypothetical protein FJ096_17010 [Deltaproteobacteria bacterium]|nr:hypothetical protein [Deltaproteobacteria bacterium]